LEAPRCRLLILAHLKGLIKPYYKNGIRSIAAENMILQSVSYDRQATYLLSRLVADSAYATLLKPSHAKDLYRSVINKFEVAHGLLFNHNISLNKLEKREQFADIVTRMMAEGRLGPKPKNLRPDLKLSKADAEALRRDGNIVEEWFIRTPEEEEIVIQMKAEWAAKYPNYKKTNANPFT